MRPRDTGRYRALEWGPIGGPGGGSLVLDAHGRGIRTSLPVRSYPHGKRVGEVAALVDGRTIIVQWPDGDVDDLDAAGVELVGWPKR